jgi:hypothetical protein
MHAPKKRECMGWFISWMSGKEPCEEKLKRVVIGGILILGYFLLVGLSIMNASLMSSETLLPGELHKSQHFIRMIVSAGTAVIFLTANIVYLCSKNNGALFSLCMAASSSWISIAWHLTVESGLLGGTPIYIMTALPAAVFYFSANRFLHFVITAWSFVAILGLTLYDFVFRDVRQALHELADSDSMDLFIEMMVPYFVLFVTFLLVTILAYYNSYVTKRTENLIDAIGQAILTLDFEMPKVKKFVDAQRWRMTKVELLMFGIIANLKQYATYLPDSLKPSSPRDQLAPDSIASSSSSSSPSSPAQSPDGSNETSHEVRAKTKHGSENERVLTTNLKSCRPGVIFLICTWDKGYLSNETNGIHANHITCIERFSSVTTSAITKLRGTAISEGFGFKTIGIFNTAKRILACPIMNACDAVTEIKAQLSNFAGLSFYAFCGSEKSIIGDVVSNESSKFMVALSLAEMRVEVHQRLLLALAAEDPEL